MLDFSRIRHHWILLFLFLLNLLLKFPYLGSNGLALDEPFSVFYAQLDLKPMISFLNTGNNPPLFEILLHFWIKCNGIGIVSVRFLPLLFSSLTGMFVFLLGKKVSGTRAGLAASLLYSFSSFNMYFAHEARVYSLFTLLSAASFFLYLSILDKPNLKNGLWLVFINVLLLLSHYFGILVVLAELLFSVLYYRSKPAASRRVLLSFILTLLVFSPMLPVAIHRLSGAVGGGTWLRVPPADAYYENIRKFSNEPLVAVFFIALMVCGVFFGFKNKVFKQNIRISLVALYFFGSYTALFLVSFFVPVFLDRYLVYLTIPFFLFIALVPDFLNLDVKIRESIRVMSCVLMLITLSLKPGNGRAPVELSDYIRENKTEKSVVFINPPWLDKGLMYYLEPEVFKKPAGFEQGMRQKGYFGVYSLSEVDRQIPSGTQKVFLVYTGVHLPSEVGPDFLFQSARQFGNSDWVLLFMARTKP